MKLLENADEKPNESSESTRLFSRLQKNESFENLVSENESISSNLDQRMQYLQNRLQFLSDSSSLSTVLSKDAVPLVKGYLEMQMSSNLFSNERWKQVWVEVHGNNLYWRKLQTVRLSRQKRKRH